MIFIYHGLRKYNHLTGVGVTDREYEKKNSLIISISKYVN